VPASLLHLSFTQYETLLFVVFLAISSRIRSKTLREQKDDAIISQFCETPVKSVLTETVSMVLGAAWGEYPCEVGVVILEPSMLSAAVHPIVLEHELLPHEKQIT
jgi:hypothetical protein